MNISALGTLWSPKCTTCNKHAILVASADKPTLAGASSIKIRQLRCPTQHPIVMTVTARKNNVYAAQDARQQGEPAAHRRADPGADLLLTSPQDVVDSFADVGRLLHPVHALTCSQTTHRLVELCCTQMRQTCILQRSRKRMLAGHGRHKDMRRKARACVDQSVGSCSLRAGPPPPGTTALNISVLISRHRLRLCSTYEYCRLVAVRQARAAAAAGDGERRAGLRVAGREVPLRVSSSTPSGPDPISNVCASWVSVDCSMRLPRHQPQKRDIEEAAVRDQQ